MYQRVGKSAYKADLSNTLLLANYLGNPENKFKSIHVAGTNGKGSTSHMLASILQEAGYKVGLYTSPHLKDFRERIKINGQPIAKRNVSSFVEKHKSFFKENQLSFFEMTVGLAFDYFSKEEVDIAVIEVGLGGRLDSTNIIIPEISIITNIGLDHTQFLGTTLPEIAKEKAGVIKENVPIVIGEYNTNTIAVFEQIAKEKNADLYKAFETKGALMSSDLKGDYQKNNIRTVQMAVKILKDKNFHIGIQHLAKGLQNVVKNTGLLGRWQILQKEPLIVCDTAHNKDGLQFTMRQLEKLNYRVIHIVLGFVSDKDLDEVLSLFPKHARYYFCQPAVERAMDVTILKNKATKHDLKGSVYPSVNDALNAAKKEQVNHDVVYVGGSTFVVAEVV
ncbi:tetrahydrofolate synthase [Patiriisocius marinistellae]|uniref:Dihydrofolate synthase/folylpolyglutamate synthase n=1 Tax=Patiriisocius marinistellae TaxID=2494560 RepID=A0A5J4G0H2_9FLAO|nr:folylpolyglutamate synthase/dihydrofolate synthase family protein [Patiriisocius marinistellae]GEQ85571.1 tetrahydrofolate synthase [Patiriisocius marinistellae]